MMKTLIYPTYKHNQANIYYEKDINAKIKKLATLNNKSNELLSSIEKAYKTLKELEDSNNIERKELVALRMFYLATKLASQVSVNNQTEFEKAMQRVLYAEQKIIELQSKS